MVNTFESDEGSLEIQSGITITLSTPEKFPTPEKIQVMQSRATRVQARVALGDGFPMRP